MMSHPWSQYGQMMVSYWATSSSVFSNFFFYLRVGTYNFGGKRVLDTTTLGCCITVLSLMDCSACTSRVISSLGSVGVGCSSHPHSTFIHSARNWSHVGRPIQLCSLCMHLWDHAALTTDHSVTPRGLVRDSSG